MNWQEVCEEPTLKDLPFKIELNRFGKIIMSPASNWHGILQMRIGGQLMSLMPGGEVISECSVETSDRTKVADVAWASTEFLEKNGTTTPFIEAPEVCIEILSPSNSDEEMTIKRELYFEKGASEVWECDEDGVMSFYTKTGKVTASEVFPTFPKRM